MVLAPEARFAWLVLVSMLGAVSLAAHERNLHPATGHTDAEVSPAPRASPAAQTGEGASLRDVGRLDPSRASAAELELLPGVGPSLAQRIVEAREKHGPFAKPEDLRRVKGIGAKTLAKLTPFLKFGSEQLEHPAEPELPLGEGGDRALLPEHALP